MKTTHKNIPIFIPHMGCPNMCVFCNQRSISGKDSFDRETVAQEIDRALSTIPEDATVEIAYFGGSFTGIDRELMIYLLDVAASYVDSPLHNRARVVGIRMSTRPDYIDEEIMEILSRYPIRTIELGLQSMSDKVLIRCRRGHTADDAVRACRLIKQQGYELIGQMMIGLPDSTIEDEIYTALKICEMGADGARIYPTVTFFETELACMAERGEYVMLDNQSAVQRSKEVLKIFEESGVDCIRIGLCASDNLGDLTKVMGGANHPALGELVIGELYYDKMCLLADEYGSEKIKGKTMIFTVGMGEISKATGQRAINKKRLKEKYKPCAIKINQANIPNLTLSISDN